jgi:hypothetical protein
MSSKGKAVFCGLGAHPPLEATLETVNAIDAAVEVFTNIQDKKIRAWIKSYSKKLTFTDDAAKVARAAKQRHICLAVWGHPIYTSAFSCDVLNRVRSQATPSEIIASLSPITSSFSRSLSFFGDTYGHTGMRTYELSTFIKMRRFVPSHIPLTIFAEPGIKAPWAKLIATLIKGYGKAHRAHLFVHDGPYEQVLALKDIPSTKLGGAVLMVPPLNGRSGAFR